MFPVTSLHPVQLPKDFDYVVTGASIYYSESQTVSSADTEVAAGSTYSPTTPTWVISASQSMLRESPSVSAAVDTGTVQTADIQNGAVTSAKLDTNIAVGGTLGVTGVSSTAGGVVTGGATPTTAAKGVTFGTGTGPATLYRSAADTLKTDDAFTAAGALTAEAAATVGTTLGVTGATTTTGGIAVTAPHGFTNKEITSATGGTDTACADGTQFVSSVFLPCNKTLTGVRFLVGSVGGTDKVYVVLYSQAGAVLANSVLTDGGATLGTAAEIQTVAFTSTFAGVGPRLYYVGVSVNGNTGKLRTVPAQMGSGLFSGSVSQTHGTVASITAPSAFAADKAPFIEIY